MSVLTEANLYGAMLDLPTSIRFSTLHPDRADGSGISLRAQRYTQMFGEEIALKMGTRSNLAYLGADLTARSLVRWTVRPV